MNDAQPTHDTPACNTRMHYGYVMDIRNMRTTTILITCALASVMGGCVGGTWDGNVQMWGTLRGVLHDGDTSAKVRLKDVAGPHCVGIGAPEGLAGEIVVLDGKTWVAQADGQGSTRTQHPAAPEATATFLAMATVPRWVNQHTNERLSLGELEQSVRAAAAAANGLDPASPFPFLVEGHFSTIELHVLNGRCPFAQPKVDDDPTHDPIRTRTGGVKGILVGFYSDGPPGTLTHSGTHVHIHALLQDERHTMGHVDTVTVEPGAEIRIPAIH